MQQSLLVNILCFMIKIYDLHDLKERKKVQLNLSFVYNVHDNS